MPLGETLTLLTTLATALQAFRLNRATETAVDEIEAPALDPALLVALDAAKAANDETVRRFDSAALGLLLLIGFSAATVLVAAFLGVSSDESADGGSPLFVASLVIFGIVALMGIALRRTCSLRSFPADALPLSAGSLPLIEGMLKTRQQVQQTNGRRLTVLQIGSDAVLLVVAVQVMLAAAWLID
jgi:hypothetical protein